ncbi:hypothetical protein PRIPAC_97155 [Pristionchus pacificus]|uniref:Uncharacterized protein n=1 Tax=Pristionchus pacificus TaxID=54126 RepID=A0A2A6D1B6_PRIPA|nr:hypothetical protein PRIPAC_97155 [Pristionchus pacificus]|eukprot:PDM84107.1 hypothetical protein PRIPAC_34299 [Pristionchus pacificus]
MWSTIISLSLSTVFGILGLCGIIGAAISSNWVEYNVNRREIVNTFNREPELNIKLKDAFIRDPLYFSRSYGLFLTCFNDAVPSDIGSFNYLTLPCVYYKDYLPSEAKQASMSSQEITRLWVLRATALLYAIGLALAVIALTLGIVACWKVSSRLIVTVGILLLFAVLCLGAAMVGWHYTQYMEKYVLEEAPFYKSWEPVLKSTSRYHNGYSYIASWFGIGFLLLSSLCMLIANCYVNKGDDKAYEAKYDAHMMNHFYDKGAVMPYYNTYNAGMDYGAYGAYPPGPYATYGGYPSAYGAAPYGYMTYGRQ